MNRRTPLYEAHVAAGGKLVDFSGWQLPLNYGSQLEEHQAVRTASGVFDVSHMTIVEIEGAGAREWLRTLLTVDVGRLENGRAAYGCLCNEAGGVLDDVIAYRLGAERWRVISNAATREKDLAWLEGHRPADVTMETADDLALLAVQGPEALELAARALGETRERAPVITSLPRFGFVAEATIDSDE